MSAERGSLSHGPLGVRVGARRPTGLSGRANLLAPLASCAFPCRGAGGERVSGRQGRDQLSPTAMTEPIGSESRSLDGRDSERMPQNNLRLLGHAQGAVCL